MFLQANPARKRSEREMKEIAGNYKPGENVVPSIANRDGDGEEDDEDRRLLEEVRELSLRENEARPSRRQGSHETETDRRRRARSHDPRAGDGDGHQRRRREAETTRRREGDTSALANADRIRNRSDSQTQSPTRQIEHQSSLRSLLSTSEVDPSEIQEEILRQIAEEGLLDGVDLSNMDRSQEDELSERIAAAYRRRHNERSRARRTRRSEPDGVLSTTAPERSEENRRHTHTRSRSAAMEVANASRMPSSSTHLEAPRASGERRRGASSSSRRRPSPADTASTRSSADNLARSPGRSSTDLSENPRSQPRPHRLSQQVRSSTDPEFQRGNERMPRPIAAERSPTGVIAAATRNRRSEPDGSSRPSSSPSTPTTTTSPTRSTERTHEITSNPHQQSLTSSHLEAPNQQESNHHSSNTRPLSSSSSNHSRPRAPLYPEPFVTCQYCKRDHIEYELYYNCDKCNNGEYNLCLSDYRGGRGCNHWYGFGYAAWHKYERLAPASGYPSGHALPHTLTGHRYLRPKQSPVPATSSNSSHRLLTTEDPVKRLEKGVFCAICLACANDCYWKCDVCNEGEWGFCNRCVNTGKCCTHPLLPLIDTSHIKPRTSPTQNASSSPTNPSPTQSQPPPTASLLRSPAGMATAAYGHLKPLTFSTLCDICRLPIQPSSARFHCPVCSDGDYDICTPCYLKLCGPAGRISRENGDKGWRRCLRGHRMLVVGFEDRDGGRKRVISRDLVGGWAMRDDPNDSVARRPADDNGEPKNRGAGANSTGTNNVRSEGDNINPSDEQRTWRDSEGEQRRGMRALTQTTVPSSSAAAAAAATAHAQGPPQQQSQAPPPDTTAPHEQKQQQGQQQQQQQQQQGEAPFRTPPDGGVGLRVLALWSYYPADGVTDELMFPRFAEVTEVDDINWDWFCGGYAGRRGLFPGNYVRVVGER
ncbi:MAG: hypothetical protein M1837_004007 [Sclerophora amabilis]|nr:MAG: hypothetical protein M1837_004007 [Sclerophora amabilis]